MSRTIWKYYIPIKDTFEIEMPYDSRILTVQVQRNKPMLWVLVNTNGIFIDGKNTGNRKFRLVGTGHPIKEGKLKYIDSFQLNEGKLVFHLFEISNDMRWEDDGFDIY